MLKIILSLFLLVYCSNLLWGNEVFDKAQWISIPQENAQPNQWLCFRKHFNCAEQGVRAQLHVAVDSKYWLWVNGKLVVFEGGLKRGPNPCDTYYDSVDLTDYLHQGENLIAVQVWFFGKDGFNHKNSGRAGLLVDLDLSDGTKIVSDDSWLVRIHPAFGESLPPYPNFRFPESNIHFDARKDIGKWQNLSYNDSSWKKAVCCGEYPCEPWNKVQKRPFPNWRDSGIIAYDSLSWMKQGQQLVGFLPRNITVTPYIRLKARPGLLIDMQTDNYKIGEEYTVRAEYVTTDGIQEFEAYNYMSGHSVIYTIPTGVEVLDVGYRETRFDTDFVGSFHCDDDFYNVLWQKALNTMNLNMRDGIQDPDRERSQWWGDATIVIGEIFYACDNNGKKAVRKAIENLIDWQKSDGVLFSPIPAGNWDKELPMQMLASVGKYGFWNYFVYTGDTLLMKKAFPAVKKYLSLWNLDEKNLVIHRTGGWDWMDWGTDIDCRVLENAWYSLALESLRNMAILLGENMVAKECEGKMSKIKSAVNKNFGTGTLYRDPFYNGRTDDRSNALAVLAGFASDEQWKSIRSYLNSYQGASPYMEKYVLESFFMKGNFDEGLRRMKSRYRRMVDHKLTTLWEHWDIWGEVSGSINHGWSGGPLTLLSQYIAGIRPIEAGWKDFMVKPALSVLNKIQCSVPLDSGNVYLNLDMESKKMYLKCDVKHRFIIAIPKGWTCRTNDSKYILNKKQYTYTQLKKLSKQDLSFYSEDELYIYFRSTLKEFDFCVVNSEI